MAFRSLLDQKIVILLFIVTAVLPGSGVRQAVAELTKNSDEAPCDVASPARSAQASRNSRRVPLNDLYFHNGGRRLTIARPIEIAPSGLMRSHRHRRYGLTLLELLATITIIGIIAAVVLPRLIVSRDLATENLCFHQKREINFAIERYFQDTGSLPTDLSDISGYLPAGVPTCPVNHSNYTLNSSSTRVEGHTKGSH